MLQDRLDDLLHQFGAEVLARNQRIFSSYREDLMLLVSIGARLNSVTVCEGRGRKCRG